MRKLVISEVDVFAYIFCNKYSDEIYTIVSATLKNEIVRLRDKRLFPRGHRIIKTALDDLTLSDHQQNTEKSDSDSSGAGTRFANRTGVFEIDFPSDNITVRNKGKGKSSKPSTSKESKVTVPTGTSPLEVQTSEANDSESSINGRSPALFTSDLSSKESTEARPLKVQAKRKVKRGKLGVIQIVELIVHKCLNINVILALRRISASCPEPQPEASTDDSDFDSNNSTVVVNKYGAPKTMRYNRPKEDKDKLLGRELAPSRYSTRLASMRKQKAKLDEVRIFFIYYA